MAEHDLSLFMPRVLDVILQHPATVPIPDVRIIPAGPAGKSTLVAMIGAVRVHRDGDRLWLSSADDEAAAQTMRQLQSRLFHEEVTSGRTE